MNSSDSKIDYNCAQTTTICVHKPKNKIKKHRRKYQAKLLIDCKVIELKKDREHNTNSGHLQKLQNKTEDARSQTVF